METRCEHAEAAAFAAVWDGLGLPRLDLAGATCIAFPPAPENTLLNRVIGLGLSAPAGDDVLDELDSFFCATGVRRYSIAVAPPAGPALEQRLAERGFAAGHAWVRFRRGVEPPADVPTELRIVDADDGETFGRIVVDASRLPPETAAGFARLADRPEWHLFLALAGDEPAGAAALLAHDGIGWFGAAATLPEHRGRGAQSALLAARIRRAGELGLELLTVETGENVPDRPARSYRNIVRAGFAEWYLRPNLISPA